MNEPAIYKPVAMGNKDKTEKVGSCAFCGVFGRITNDHVPPKNLFHGHPDDELIKVPACDECNQGAKKDDEYFRAFLVAQAAVSDHPQAQKLNDHIRKKMDENERKGFEALMFSQLQIMELVTPSGIVLERQKVHYADYSRLQKILKKIVKGLYYREFGRILPSTLNIAVVDVKQIAEMEDFLRADVAPLVAALETQTSINIHDIFEYKVYALIPETPFVTAWSLTFFLKRQFFGITYPASLAPELTLGDPDPAIQTNIPWE